MNCRKAYRLCHLSALMIALLIPTLSICQNYNAMEKQAVKNFRKGNYVKARNLFQTLREAKWNEDETNAYLAQCYLELHEPEKSYEVLSSISSADEEILYLKTLSSYFSERFSEADSLVKKLQEIDSDSSTISKMVLAGSTQYKEEKGYVVQNFGENVNSKDREYSAVMYNDYNKLLFTSRREENSNTDSDGMAFETIYSTSIDSTDNWRKVTPFKTKIGQESAHDATVQVYQSGQKLIHYHDGKLFKSTLKSDGTWSKEESLAIHDFDGIDTHCYITPDENTIFFASDFHTYGEHLDLFYSQKNAEGSWSEPVPMDVFNTEFDEDSPFLANDSTFYFSSRGHHSIGGFDVFKSTYNAQKKTWSEPENLGFPINTVAEDTYYTTDGKLSYLSSSRLGGYGSLDLYRVFLFNKVKLQGVLFDKDKNTIPDATIHIDYDSTTLTSYTDANGHYEMFVPISKQMQVKIVKDSLNLFNGNYIINIFVKDHNNNEFNFYVDNAEDVKKEDDKAVDHINIEVRNDYRDNEIVESVPTIREKPWAADINQYYYQKRQMEIASREVSIAQHIDEERANIRSDNVSILGARIKRARNEDGAENAGTKKAKNTYTVQILAMPIQKAPDSSFFDLVDVKVVENRDGKDGLRRFYIGAYASKRKAVKQMKALRKTGYSDAFVRKLSKYAKL